MKASQLFVKCLEAAEVQYIFGVPGEENLALLDAIRQSSIQFITTRDEQSAVFMAATVGRLTGRVGVALSTLGPGATNLVTGVAYAQLGGMPVMVITGQKPVKKSKQGAFQIIDVVRMMEPITKMAKTAVSGDRIPSLVYQAIKLAESERPGAVHLELPEDIADEETSANPIPWQHIRRPGPDPEAISTAIQMIAQSKHPIIVIGAGANRKLIRKHLKFFIEKTQIPFITTQMGKGVEDESSALYLGTTALSSDDYVHKILQRADLIVMIGHDIIEKPPLFSNNNQHIIHINFYPADVDDVYTPAYEVLGDISHSLWQLTEHIKVSNKWDFSYFFQVKEQLLQEINTKSDSSEFPLKPQRILADLRSVIPRDGVLSLDNGMYKLWIARGYPVYEQNTLLLDNAFATMGAGLPVGIAAKLLYPERKVVVVAGDGGFMMNVAELETAKRLNLDLVVIILNDNGFGMIQWKQAGMNLPQFGLSFENPDFVTLAKSFGATGYRITKANDLKSTLQTALQSEGIHIIECPIDYSENNIVFGKSLKERTEKL